MIVLRLILFVFLLALQEQASAKLEAVVDLTSGQESLLITDDTTECARRCLEIHHIGGYALFVLRDDDGSVSPHVLPWLDDSGELDPEFGMPDSKFLRDSSGRRTPLTGNGGNCGHDRVNCIETFIVPGGYVVIIEYGADGKIKSYKTMPVLQQK
jgi:hypothetical protein